MLPIARFNARRYPGPMSIVRDNTERTPTEEQVSQLRHEQQVILDNAVVSIAKVRNRTIVWANRGFENMMGYSAGELDGAPTRQLYVTQADYEALGARAYSVIRRGGVFRGEARFRRKDGRIIWSDISSALLDEDKGETLWGFSDITERKQSEQTIQREREKYQALLRNASDGIHILDIDGNLVEASDSFCTMIGYRREELIGMNVSQWDARFTADELLHLVRQQFEHPVRSQFETLHRRKDGTVFAVEVSGFPLELGGIRVLFNSSRDIGERKRVEKALERAKDYAQNLIRTANTMVVELDRDGHLKALNPAAEQITGYSTEELKGRDWFEILAPRERYPFVWQEFNRLAAGGAPERFENPILTKSGEERYIVWQNSVQRENGEFAGFVSFGVDLTERVRMERALLASEEKLRGLYELSPLGIALTDMKGRFIEFNEAFRKISGYSVEELKALDYWAITPGKYEADEVQRLVDLERAGHYGPYEKEYIRKDGSTIPLRLNGMLITGNDGQQYIWSIVEDITDRQAAESELRKLSAVIEQSPASIVITDLDANIQFVNPQFTRVTGYERSEAIGSNPRILKSGLTSLETFQEMWKSLTNGQAWHGELLNKRKNGELYWEEAHLAPLKDAVGTTTHYVGVKVEITKRKEAEESLRLLKETLERRIEEAVAANLEKERLFSQQARLAAMGEMIGNIAHQWRQPLTALALLLADIKDAFEYEELDGEYLDKSVKESAQLIQRMSATIDDFRNFLKPNKEKQVFRARDSVEEAIKLIMHSFSENNIEIELKKSEGPCDVVGYPNEFAQVVLNALSNAKDVLVEKPARGTVQIQIEKGTDRATVAIRDNGGGIPGDILPKVFDPHFTTKEQGTGIGLYMSKMIMDNMGGGIAVQNVNGGAEVLLALPLATEPSIRRPGEGPLELNQAPEELRVRRDNVSPGKRKRSGP